MSRLAVSTFESIFGVVMVALLVPTLRKPSQPRNVGQAPAQVWSRPTTAAVFFAIGLYGGAFQAGVGIVLIFALSRAGYDLVRANSVKVVVIAALTLIAIPVFVFEDQVAWTPAVVLALGFGLGGVLGARLAVLGGEALIRPVLVVAVVALAGRMLHLY